MGFWDLPITTETVAKTATNFWDAPTPTPTLANIPTQNISTTANSSPQTSFDTTAPITPRFFQPNNTPTETLSKPTGNEVASPYKQGSPDQIRATVGQFISKKVLPSIISPLNPSVDQAKPVSDFFSSLLPTDRVTKIDNRAQSLISQGIDPTRAYDIAHSSLTKSSFDLPESQAATKKYNDLKVTPQEDSILSSARYGEIINDALAASNFVGGGFTKSIGAKILTIAGEKDAGIIATHLIKMGVPADRVGTLANVLSKVDKPEVVNKIIQDAIPVPKAGLLNRAVESQNAPAIAETYNADKQVIKAFNESKPVTQVGSFELGTFGKNALERKTLQKDRIPTNELKDTVDNIQEAYKASSDFKNYRSDNIAWISDMPNGEKRVIYTRLNASGKEEIINAHIISDPKYLEDIVKNGAPERTRTSKLLVRTELPYPLGDRGNLTLPPKDKVSQGTTRTPEELATSKSKVELPQKSGRLSAQETSSTVSSKVGNPQSVKSTVVNRENSVSSLPKTIPQDFNADKYISEQVAKREGARTAEKVSTTGKIKSFLADAKAKLVDFASPIEDVLNKSVKESGTKLLPSEDIHNQIDRVLRSPTLAGQFAKDNGIVDVIKKVDNPDALDQYLIAKHAIELENKGIKTGRDIIKDKALVASLGTKYESYAKVVSQYSQKLLEYSVDSGLISKELADTLKARYPDYVPFQRVFNEIEKTTQHTGTSAAASLSKQNVIQRIEGSTREIESPIESLLTKTNDAFKQGEKNKAGKMLAGYENLKGNPFQLRELKLGETAEHTISFLDNGVKRTFETTKEVEQAAKSLNVQQLNILGKILAFPVRIARVGITGLNLPFVGANLAKDQISAFINSTHGLKTSIANPVNLVKSLFSAVGHDELYQEMVRAGGAGTSFDISRNQVEQTVKGIRADRNITSKILYTVTKPSELLKIAEDIISRGEELTRIQQYKGTKDALIKDGMSEKEAIIAGARQAREATVNFQRRGEWGTVLNSAFLYLNAGIQGTRTLLGSLEKRPLQTATKIAISTFFPIATITAWNLSDQERKQAYEDIPDYEKENNIILIPSNPVKDANGKWNVIKIPLSQEINNMSAIVRKGVEQAHGLDPIKFGDFASALIGTVSPVNPTKGSVLSAITPQAIKPTLEGALNKSLFTGYPIVSDTMSKLPPENQIKPDTSKLAIRLGTQLGVSPIQIDAFIKSTFGGLGQQITGQQNVVDAVTARFNKASGGAQQQKDMESMQKYYDKVQQLIKNGDNTGAQKMVDDLGDHGYEIYKKIKSQEQTVKTIQGKQDILPTYQKVQQLMKSGNVQEATDIVNGLTDDQYKYYEAVKKQQVKPTGREMFKSPNNPVSQESSLKKNIPKSKK